MPAAWCEGVARLAILPPPNATPAARWAALAATSARLLREHGAELHRAGWGAYDLFGLHPVASATRSDCMGLAMLLDGRRVGAITPETIRIVTAGGHSLRV